MAKPRKFTQRHYKSLEEIAARTPKVSPIQNDTPAKRSARIEKVSGDDWEAFAFFCKTYFPHIFRLPFCQAHRIMFEQVHNHTGITALTGFRGLGKTVEMGVVYPIWRVINGERYVIHVAADEDLAKGRTAFTRHELSANVLLRGDFPALAPLDKDDGDFYLRNETRIQARGVKQSVRGLVNPRTARRPGLVICDDIDKEENIGNQTIGRRRMNKIIQEMGGALDPQNPGRVIWLGNLVHPNFAICQYLEQLKEAYTTENPAADADALSLIRLQERAIVRIPVEDAAGKSVWPEQYPNAGLPALRAKFGNVGYLREYMGQPVIEGNMFKHEWFLKWDKLPVMKRVWLYCDPAWGEKGCYKGVIAIGYDGKRFYVTHVWLRQAPQTRLFSYLYDAWVELNKTYGVRFRAGIETTYGQHRILRDFDRWCKDTGRASISHHFKHIDNRVNKHLRIERTETAIQTGKVLFPNGQDTPTLISQFLTYPQGYIDGCDALAGCLERFTEYSPTNKVRVRTFRY